MSVRRLAGSITLASLILAATIVGSTCIFTAIGIRVSGSLSEPTPAGVESPAPLAGNLLPILICVPLGMLFGSLLGAGLASEVWSAHRKSRAAKKIGYSQSLEGH